MSCIAIIDTGVSPHLDLVIPNNRIVRFVDIIDNKKDPYDDNGHGTFLAGMVASNGLLSGHKLISPSYTSNIFVIKAIDGDGRASKTDIIKAIDVILDNYIKYDIRVVLMSFGSDIDSKDSGVLGEAIAKLYNLNIIVVCASGNGGNGNIMSPASLPYVISVGSVDDDLNICPFTSRDTIDGVDLPLFYALGKDVIGLSRTGYTKMSGTSVSAPYVASIVSLIKDELPDCSLEDVIDILRRLAIRHNGVYII